MAVTLSKISTAQTSYYLSHEAKITKVQAFVRGWLLRKAIEPERKFLRHIVSLDEEELQQYEKAELGTIVYFIDHVVLKRRDHCRQDYIASSQARAICKKDHLDCIVIPTCRVYSNHIIEERLPLSPYLKEQIGTYIENKGLFDCAIKQFITFYLQTNLHDIVGNTGHPFQGLVSAKIPRYDNVCFFIEEGKGKIALVDLEKFELCKNWFNRNLDDCLFELVTLFPYHLDLILSNIEEQFPYFKIDKEKYQVLQKKIFAYFNIVYFDHKSFLLAKNVTLQTPKSGQINPTDEEVKDIAEKTGMRVEKVESTIIMLNMSISFLTPCQNWPELLSKRSVIFDHDERKINVQILKELRERNLIALYSSYGSIIVHL